MIKAAPRSQSEAVLQAGLPVRQKIRSQTNVATRKATGNGISIGWSGCPAIWAVLCGLRDDLLILLRVASSHGPISSDRCEPTSRAMTVSVIRVQRAPSNGNTSLKPEAILACKALRS